MKKLINTILLTLFAGSLNAATDAEIYHGFAAGNPDLETSVISDQSLSAEEVRKSSDHRMVKRSRVTDRDIYQGFEQGNPDLWSGDNIPAAAARVTGNSKTVIAYSSIYHGFESGNPDL